MSRRLEEFMCDRSGGGCGKYFQTYLRESMWGNYTFRCPSCGHDHYRVISKGLITQDRHDQRKGTAQIIVGLGSTVRDTPWHDDPDFRRRQMQAYNNQF